ncbi:hypothetical protein D3869_09190 [Azospirillum brasilense]|uniref:Uncharacterized protein n=1 Tax=Azospirillum brasilense TaxID=192 RepID=A0A4D8R1M3_AZOBR|nr:hypothetical protein [Azospirillum brasilense]QCO15384.1 hypothetical protein D3869_09190 [Azospirillum brasilense]
MSIDETPDRIAVPPPDLSDLDRQKAEIEAIQAQMAQWRARIDQRLNDRRPTIDLDAVHLDEPPTAAPPAAIRPTE